MLRSQAKKRALSVLIALSLFSLFIAVYVPAFHEHLHHHEHNQSKSAQDDSDSCTFCKVQSHLRAGVPSLANVSVQRGAVETFVPCRVETLRILFFSEFTLGRAPPSSL